MGQDAGNALRSALAGYRGTDKKQTPHIRKAHWHGYWKGSKKENTQEFFYKWIPPVVVNQYAENALEQGGIT